MKKTAAILWRNLLNFSRDKIRIIASFAMSFFFLFVFSFVMKSSAVGKISQPMNYLICGIIIMTVFQQALNNSTAVLDDISSGFMKEILVAPISRCEISIGEILSSSVIAILQGLIVLIAGMFMGLHIDVLHFIETVGIMVIAGITFGSIGLFIATVAKGSSAFQILSAILVMPLSFLSGAYIPTTIMPHFLLPVVYMNPLTYITSIFRFITMHMDNFSAAQLVQEGVAYNIDGFILMPQTGFLIIIAIGICFFVLCVHKFDRADFSTVKTYRHH
ncbi:ABC transporter permease [uncultured Clostridium sp.]|jgi:ABC-2 type transport system permease protein|uniref:ABC transporter permease n=1 Tax=uncultured Clostridium sp. TaxID=59620 RepID=UPI0025F774AC|nr:ABC transporter permease [uncultured Clostridium sp.]